MAKKSTVVSSATTEKKKKEYKLDLFGQTLPALYKCDFGFYDRCTEDERKEISPLILMRWISLGDNQELAPEMVNSFVNLGFWQLSKHPELQWKLLCMVASEISRNRMPRHTWMMPKKKKSATPLLDGYLIQMYPMNSDYEIGILKQKLDGEDSVKDLVRQFGGSDKEIKDAVKEYRDIYGSKSA